MTTINDTKSTILDVALDMIQRQSISGVSFQALAKQVGIKKGSMYYHFESKDELAMAVLERAASDLAASFEQGSHKTAQQRLQYFFGIYRSKIGAGEKLCPGGAFVGEWDALSAQVQSCVSKLINTQTQGIEQIISDGLAAGEFTGHGQSPSALAIWLISSIQGALLTARVAGHVDAFDISVSIINQYLSNTTQD